MRSRPPLLLLAAHVAAVLLSYGPPALPIGTRLLRRWLRRGAVVAVAAPLVWLVAVRGGRAAGAARASGSPGSACAIVVCVVAATAVSDAARSHA